MVFSWSGYGKAVMLLIALAANPASDAARMLRNAGVSANEIQEAVIASAPRPCSAARPGSGTPTLDWYGRDLTEVAREGRLDPVVGREDEIEQSLRRAAEAA
nr:Clp protease N-terminal domain-containing protein [Sinosporangium album]